MKKIISLVIVLLSCLTINAETKPDTLKTSRLETQYKAKMAFSAKRACNVIYTFKSGDNKYEITCFGIPTIVYQGALPIMNYEVKKAYKNGEEFELKRFESYQNLYEGGVTIIMYYDE